MSGGPSARGPRGRSSQSRACSYSPTKSTRPRRSKEWTITSVSAKRLTRWSQRTTGNLVDGLGDLREQRRIAVVGATDERPERDLGAGARERGQERPGFPDADRCGRRQRRRDRSAVLVMNVSQVEEEMVGQPERIEAGRFGQPSQGQEVRPAREVSGSLGRPLVRQLLRNGGPGRQEQPGFERPHRRLSHGDTSHRDAWRGR